MNNFHLIANGLTNYQRDWSRHSRYEPSFKNFFENNSILVASDQYFEYGDLFSRYQRPCPVIKPRKQCISNFPDLRNSSCESIYKTSSELYLNGLLDQSSFLSHTMSPETAMEVGRLFKRFREKWYNIQFFREECLAPDHDTTQRLDHVHNSVPEF